jgi:hypothetical protein
MGDHHDDDSFRRQLLTSRRNLEIPEFTGAMSSSQLPDTSSWLDVSKLGFNTLSLPADFSTYNIAIFTKLDITIEVSCADKKFKMTKDSSMMVLPPTYLRINNPAGYVSAPLLPPIAGPSEPPAPPPYEPAPDYGEVGESSAAYEDDQKVAIDKLNGKDMG